MIDIVNDRLIVLAEVPKILPRKSGGKRLNLSTVYRWVQRGVNGKRLEAVRLGGVYYTSSEALQRFAESPFASDQSTENPRHRPDRDAAFTKASRELDELGISDTGETPDRHAMEKRSGAASADDDHARRSKKGRAV
jgi:hypothetical protein